MAFNTGNPVEPNGSTDPRDLRDNAQILDKLVNSSDLTWLGRLHKTLKTWAGMTAEHEAAQAQRVVEFNQFLESSGYEVPVDYVAGLSITRPTQTVRFSGELYRPKDASLPFTTSTWAADSAKFFAVGDSVLRQEIASPDGANMVLFTPSGSGSVSRTVQVKLREFVSFADYSSTANFNVAKVGKLSYDGLGRLRSTAFIAGDAELVAPTTRDGFVVGRIINGPTDCHAFADRTEIAGASDSGTYGTFDATTKWSGSNTQAHLYSFQDRSNVAGSGELTAQAGFISLPVHTGSGNWVERKGVRIADVPITGGGTLGVNVGLAVDNLGAGTNQIGLQLLNGFGFSMYAPGGAASFHKGYFGFGVVNTQGTALQIAGGVIGGQSAFIDTSTTDITFGSVGNFPIRILTNGAQRWEFSNSAHAHAFIPMVDNILTIGDATARVSTIYLGSAPVVTSDARTKTPVRKMTDAELSAAKALGKEIGVFKFLQAVQEKGAEARDHIGMTVQRVIEILADNGLDPMSYAFICHDEWEGQEEIIETVDIGTLHKKSADAEGPEFLQISKDVAEPQGDDVEPGVYWTKTGTQTRIMQEALAAGDRYSFRMDQLLAFIAAGFEARISALEERA